MEQNYIRATGRRKTATARVRLYENGTGQMTVNGLTPEEYFPTLQLRMKIMQPLVLAEKTKGVDIKTTINGGGKSGQAEALRHGISRALIALEPELRGTLKKEGLLTRDPRMKERKKYGQPGARKRFQFSKR